ncbi:MAG TPA: adenylate kinase [Kiritimatiellia bacterium]|jgi:adenylate kinase|nr:adenylate kinase [Kiritimatiellia bacterium]
MDVVILLGAPGSGKGTVAGRLVAADKTLRHVSSGDLLRDAVRRHTAAGDEAEAYMKRGELVPDALIARLVAELMAELNGPRMLLLDGFPRTVVQAQMLDRTVEDCGVSLAAVVLLDVPDEILVNRIAGRRLCPACGAGYHVTNIPPRVEGICDACGSALKVRKDDNPETAKNRLAVYQAQTVPLIEFYEARGLLRRVPGTGPIDEIVEGARRAL